MNEISPSPQDKLSPNVARRHITLFDERFGQEHLYLAYHAALPLVLTPELLYGLRAKFPYDIHGVPLNIPWIAVADLLLSSLCNKVDRELYEIHVSVRNELLKDMKEHERFGEQRINELSDFLLSYVRPQLKSHDRDVQDLAEAQRWTALAYTEPKLAARELTLALQSKVQEETLPGIQNEALRSDMREENQAEQWRIASLIETLAEPLAEFASPLADARSIAHIAYSNGESEEAKLKAEAKIKQVQKILKDFYDDASPTRECICPSCFEEIPLWECKIISGKTGRVLKDIPKDFWERQMARLKPEQLDLPAYKEEAAHRQCPRCGYLLPYNIERVKNITLAIVGDTFSGKSHYIASLIHQIQTEWIGKTGGFAQLTCLTPEIEEIYRKEYFERLYTERKSILPNKQGTNEKWNPLIYELVMYSPSSRSTSVINLMIYDASGEDFGIAESLVKFARFIFNANAFVFVADPFTMSPIFNQLPPLLRDTLREAFTAARAAAPVRRAADMLNATISLYERYHGLPEGGSPLADIPVAVMVSKADLFNYLNSPTRYHFMTNPGYGDGVNLQDINVVDQEVKELLQVYKAGDLVTTTSRFKQVKFFATSATGEPADASGHYMSVEPCRCLDPFLWILYQFGIIEARKFDKELSMSSTPSYSQSEPFDVFLCHNNKDKDAVKEIAKQLQAQGITPWLDEWEARPGLPWQPALEQQIGTIKSAAVFVGADGLGPWQNMEMDAFLREFVRRGCPVIPILLKTAPDKPELPPFLAGMTWVNFHKPEPDPVKQLIWGITSKKPDTSVGQSDSNQSPLAQVPSIPKTLSFPKRAELVKTLLACSCVRNRDSRETILGLLNEQIPGIANTISRRTDNQADVMEIISTCLNHAGGLQEFVAIVTYLEGESSIPTQQLKAFMQSNAF